MAGLSPRPPAVSTGISSGDSIDVDAPRRRSVGWSFGGKKSSALVQPGGVDGAEMVAPVSASARLSPSARSLTTASLDSLASQFDDDVDDAEESVKLAEERARTRRLWLLHPTQPTKLAWDAVLALLVIYSVLMVPIRVGFGVEAARGGAWEFEVLVDFVFLLDVLVNFRSAYYTHHAATVELETSACRISRRYGGSWFLIDLLSSVPLDLILHLAIPDAGDDAGGGLCGVAGGASGGGAEEASDTETLKLVKLLKGLRLVRLLKLLRLFKIGRFLQKLQDELEINPTVIELLKLGVKMLFLMHMVGCGWNWMRIPPLHDDEAENALPTWMDAVPDLAAYAVRCEAAPFGELYTAAMLWALTTMSTIGFGDIKAITNFEKFYSMIIMLVGSVIFGIVIGGMTALMAQFDAVAVRAQERMDMIKVMLHPSAPLRCPFATASPGLLLAASAPLGSTAPRMHSMPPTHTHDRTSDRSRPPTPTHSRQPQPHRAPVPPRPLRRRCASGASRTNSQGRRNGTTRTTSPTAPTCRQSRGSSPSCARRCGRRCSCSSTRGSSRASTSSAGRTRPSSRRCASCSSRASPRRSTLSFARCTPQRTAHATRTTHTTT